VGLAYKRVQLTRGQGLEVTPMSSASAHTVVVGLRCTVCGTRVDISTPFTWTCPHSSSTDRHHVFRFESELEPFRPVEHSNPFVAYRRYLAVDALGAGLGLSDQQRIDVIEKTDEAIARVYGVGFLVTPFVREDALSDALDFMDNGGIWVKDETRNVAGSHKARHLFTELLHLLMIEVAGRAPWTLNSRPSLAIASCGNASIAASTLAAAVQWPITVFVPVAVEPSVMTTLTALGADVRVCPRLDSDQPGDPCVHRFRESVANGSLAFGVQGTENAWCLDGGRTIGWEMLTATEIPMDRIFIQVGGGALASCVGESMNQVGIHPRLHAVQAAGCAPLSRAWDRALATGGTRNAGSRWGDIMWPWEVEPSSLADGILDDETYDWIGVVDSMTDTGGWPVVASEENIIRAWELATTATSINVSPTGAAGLAGVLEMRHHIGDDERIAVVFSGVARSRLPLSR